MVPTGNGGVLSVIAPNLQVPPIDRFRRGEAVGQRRLPGLMLGTLILKWGREWGQGSLGQEK